MPVNRKKRNILFKYIKKRRNEKMSENKKTVSFPVAILTLLVVAGIVMVSGLVICVVSTYFVVGKLVSLKKDELYY